MNIYIVVWILTTGIIGCYSYSKCSPQNGNKTYRFLPALPGKTPSCARPGLTYCEHPDHYPRKLIHDLIKKWRYDHTSLQSDESRDDFAPHPSPVYGPPNYPSYGPNNVIPPSENGAHYSPSYQQPNYYPEIGSQIAQDNNNYWKRRVENNHERLQDITGEPLCQSHSQYIVPKAALNSKGNWMYVVNIPEVDQRSTQLVKSETCVSPNCSGICSLPQDYTSRCEQKFVERRLLALDGEGNEICTDEFWFPSACVCTTFKT